MKGRSDTLNNDCYFVYLLVIWNFEIWPVIWPQMHLGRFCLSLLTGKDSCLAEMSLDRNAREYRALRESLNSIMISYYWSNVDNGFQTNASSFLAAALNSSDLETKGATCLSRESSWRAKRWANACSLHDSPCIAPLPMKNCCGSPASEYCHRQFLPLPEWNCTPKNSSTPFSFFRLRFDLR